MRVNESGLSEGFQGESGLIHFQVSDNSFSPQPTWHPYLSRHGHLLDVSLSYPALLWPWSGYLAVNLGISKEGSEFSGEVEGHISLTVSSSVSLY